MTTIKYPIIYWKAHKAEGLRSQIEHLKSITEMMDYITEMYEKNEDYEMDQIDKKDFMDNLDYLGDIKQNLTELVNIKRSYL